MELTDTSFIIAMSVFALLLFGVAVVFLPRMRGAWYWVLGRVATLAVVCLAVLVSVAAVLNAQNYWYTSWADLFGDTSVPEVKTIGSGGGGVSDGGSTGAFPLRPRTSDFPALPDPGTRLQKYTITGASSRITADVLVQLPEDYAAKVASGHKFAVLMGYHGMPGGPMTWITGMKGAVALDAAAQGHRLADTILVMPTLNPPGTTDTECVDGPPGTPQVETWLAKDVPAFVADHFPVKANRTAWATIGYSYGGWCSAMVSVKHPDLFGGGLVMGGYFAPDFAPGADPFPKGGKGLAAYDLPALIKVKAPPLAMWIQSGTLDGYLSSTRTFLNNVRAPLSVTAVIMPNVGHRASVWIELLPDALTWLGKTLPGFAP